jgi:hypothetical protein
MVNKENTDNRLLITGKDHSDKYSLPEEVAEVVKPNLGV